MPASIEMRGMYNIRRTPTHFRTRLAWLTKFSMTPSNASFSLMSPSNRFNQYSSTELARKVADSSSWTCPRSSLSVRPSRAASVVAHRRCTAGRSNSGGGEGSLRREVRVRDCWLGPGLPGPLCVLSRLAARLWERECAIGGVEERRVSSRLTEGRMSFFCLEAGRISSRSTGTPSETRKSRRMRDFTQFWGWSGGGATS